MKTIPSHPPHKLIDLYVRSGFYQGFKNDKQLAHFANKLGSTSEAVEQAILEPDPKVVEQYQHVMIHAVLARDGVINGMDWHCSR